MSHNQAVANRPNSNGGAVAPVQLDGIEAVLIGGDLSKLSSGERLEYYQRLCHSLGLNSLTRPFQYVTLSGKLTLYATKDCSEQLRKKNGISITDLQDAALPGDLYRVRAFAQDATGKVDVATGVLSIKGLGGEALANAMMKAETKAKRRVTLSISGLGMLDETETDFDDEPPTAPDRPTTQAPPKRGTQSSRPPINQVSREEFERDEPIEGEARDVTPPTAAAREEPPISRFWKDVRALGISREQVIEHLGHERFEEMDSDALGELLIQLRDKHGKAQPALV